MEPRHAPPTQSRLMPKQRQRPMTGEREVIMSNESFMNSRSDSAASSIESPTEPSDSSSPSL